jgi:hypothetical protein
VGVDGAAGVGEGLEGPEGGGGAGPEGEGLVPGGTGGDPLLDDGAFGGGRPPPGGISPRSTRARSLAGEETAAAVARGLEREVAESASSCYGRTGSDRARIAGSVGEGEAGHTQDEDKAHKYPDCTGN